MEWTDIQKQPQGLRAGEQMVRIASIRPYTNANQNRCIELVFENDDGGRSSFKFSVELHHQTFIEDFLRTFLCVSISAVLARGGWETLVGSEFMVDVDFPDGNTPVFQLPTRLI